MFSPNLQLILITNLNLQQMMNVYISTTKVPKLIIVENFEIYRATNYKLLVNNNEQIKFEYFVFYNLFKTFTLNMIPPKIFQKVSLF